ncbi:hypothetical protein [Nitrincola sp. MINF-07-Sa-05]|uniref:hypothetical protein n=1 Tax=Nitrincola salilacus TaxID=3400273 RepID=UPI0039183F2F
MKKSDWIWVSIRIFGIYLLVLAIISIPDAIGIIYGLVNMADAANSSSELASFVNSLYEAALIKGATTMSQLAIFSVAAYYFLRHGKLIHKMANNNNE